MRVAVLIYFVFMLFGCSVNLNSPQGKLSDTLNQLMEEFGQERDSLQVDIAAQIRKEQPSVRPNLILLQATMAISDDRLDVAQQSIHELRAFESLTDEQLGIIHLLEATAYYSLGQIDKLDNSLDSAITKLDKTDDPTLRFWLEANKLLISAFRDNDVMFEQSVGYVLPRIETVPNNLLGQFMLNMVAIGLVTEKRLNEAINVENVIVSRDEETGNIKGLSDSYYNLGNIYRGLLQPELALLNFMQCLDYAEQLDSQKDQAFALQQLTVVALELDDQERAKIWAKEAHTLAFETNTRQLYIPTKITLAKVIAEESPSESMKLIKEARDLSSKFKVTQFIHEIEIVEEKLASIEKSNE